MELAVDWHKPVRLTHSKEPGLIYTADLEALPRKPGVYIFARKFGSKLEALYVGRSTSIRGRIKGHLNSVKLMHHLSHAKSGRLLILPGVFVPKPGQQTPKSIALIEDALIRHFISNGHNLSNVHGATIRFHRIASNGRAPTRFIPNQLNIEF